MSQPFFVVGTFFMSSFLSRMEFDDLNGLL